ncbi:hypothetical protein THIOM_003817 [Candidatus Thiomargarita nelsonii]|uniref:Uncharacterized protein n=1 Tax=Candidatus Thiomargarita nelsonii TaxID=1003181 RepID=A0A176RXQ6_9GAMM|nr:hypothetical protein THIOM_003817 [Candidatus Thiomargarita nelsonii]
MEPFSASVHHVFCSLFFYGFFGDSLDIFFSPSTVNFVLTGNVGYVLRTVISTILNN